MPAMKQDEPSLVRADEAEFLPVTGITLLADASETSGSLTSNRSFFPEGGEGAPPHYHSRASELFFMLDGALQVLLGEQVMTMNRGDFLVVPPGVTHAFAPAPNAAADVLFVYTPGTPRNDYYRLLEQVYSGTGDPEEIKATQERFDNHYVESAVWAQARVRR